MVTKKISRDTSYFPAEIPTKNIPNESLQTICYADLLGTDVRQKIIPLFVYSYYGFNIYKQEEACLLRGTKPIFIHKSGWS
jgi:hypothetical protein